ncbi:hypothetical protein HDU76_002545, partial [Blyttiomyces sp. JEL0837]
STSTLSSTLDVGGSAGKISSSSVDSLFGSLADGRVDLTSPFLENINDMSPSSRSLESVAKTPVDGRAPVPIGPPGAGRKGDSRAVSRFHQLFEKEPEGVHHQSASPTEDPHEPPQRIGQGGGFLGFDIPGAGMLPPQDSRGGRGGLPWDGAQEGPQGRPPMGPPEQNGDDILSRFGLGGVSIGGPGPLQPPMHLGGGGPPPPGGHKMMSEEEIIKQIMSGKISANARMGGGAGNPPPTQPHGMPTHRISPAEAEMMERQILSQLAGGGGGGGPGGPGPGPNNGIPPTRFLTEEEILRMQGIGRGPPQQMGPGPSGMGGMGGMGGRPPKMMSEEDVLNALGAQPNRNRGERRPDGNREPEHGPNVNAGGQPGNNGGGGGNGEAMDMNRVMAMLERSSMNIQNQPPNPEMNMMTGPMRTPLPQIMGHGNMPPPFPNNMQPPHMQQHHQMPPPFLPQMHQGPPLRGPPFPQQFMGPNGPQPGMMNGMPPFPRPLPLPGPMGNMGQGQPGQQMFRGPPLNPMMMGGNMGPPPQGVASSRVDDQLAAMVQNSINAKKTVANQGGMGVGRPDNGMFKMLGDQRMGNPGPGGLDMQGMMMGGPGVNMPRPLDGPGVNMPRPMDGPMNMNMMPFGPNGPGGMPFMSGPPGPHGPGHGNMMGMPPGPFGMPMGGGMGGVPSPNGMFGGMMNPQQLPPMKQISVDDLDKQ